MKQAGYRWRKARVVLTSNDSEFSEKFHHIQSILTGLKADEAFFSIDEYGPLAIKAQPGRALVGPNEQRFVQQWQRSKGSSRAVIHNSDYQSVDAVKAAIDRYFSERNAHFRDHPQRAGGKVWGKEPAPTKFSEFNNCKDPGFG